MVDVLQIGEPWAQFSGQKAASSLWTAEVSVLSL